MFKAMFAPVAILALALPATAQADTVYPSAVTRINLTGAAYTQNFDTLASTGTSSTLPVGWQVFEGGSNSNGTYTAGSGTANTGDVYSFGSAGSTDRALGSLASGSLSPIYYGALFTNNLGSAITSLGLSYTGEQWRRGTATDDGLTFQYSLDAPSISTGTWTTFAPLGFGSPNTGSTSGALDGNAVANRTALSATLTGLSIANGGIFAVRWVDMDNTGSDDGLAVDDFSLVTAASAVPEPATWASMLLGLAFMGAVLRRRKPLPAIA